MSWGVFLVFMGLWYLFFLHVDNYMHAHQSLGVVMTVNEFSHPERYKYLFDTELVKTSSGGRSVKYVHKKVHCMTHVLNPFIYLLSCKSKPLEQQRSSDYQNRKNEKVITATRDSYSLIKQNINRETATTEASSDGIELQQF